MTRLGEEVNQSIAKFCGFRVGIDMQWIGPFDEVVSELPIFDQTENMHYTMRALRDHACVVFFSLRKTEVEVFIKEAPIEAMMPVIEQKVILRVSGWDPAYVLAAACLAYIGIHEAMTPIQEESTADAEPAND